LSSTARQQIADRRRLVGGETGPPQVLIGQGGQGPGRGRVLAEQREEARMDSGGRLPGELLVEDRTGEGGEVPALGPPQFQPAGAPAVDEDGHGGIDVADCRGCPGQLLYSSHVASSSALRRTPRLAWKD
jgi:hypothetical protein